MIGPTVDQCRERTAGAVSHRVGQCVVGALCLMAAGGCTSLERITAGGWAADYDTAEARVRETGHELFIFFHDADPSANTPLVESLNAPAIKQRLTKYIRCMLYGDHEADRRYVAQFGVRRGPALIVVHGDGTYHARTGRAAPAAIQAFLDNAVAPGEQARSDTHLPHRAAYTWHRSLASAEAAARRMDRPLVIAFYRPLTMDWRRLNKVLACHEVYRRLGTAVHCRLETWWLGGNDAKHRFGVTDLPAVVIVRRDGSYEVLQRPASAEAVARFADRCFRPHAAATVTPGAGP